MRRTIAFALLLPALTLPFAACGDQEEVTTPVACLGEPGAWVSALTPAPDQVTLGDSTPISECLPADQPAGQQETVGRTAVEVATLLSRGIRFARAADPDSPVPTGRSAAVQAGYLVGALEKGAEDTQGIHATLVDRVEAAATNGLGENQEIQGAYQEGHEAGLESG